MMNKPKHVMGKICFFITLLGRLFKLQVTPFYLVTQMPAPLHFPGVSGPYQRLRSNYQE